MGRSNFGGEGAVCCSETCNRSAITSHINGEVGDAVYFFFLVNLISQVFVLLEVICRFETGARGSDLQFEIFLVSGREESFKGHPCFLAAGRRFQVLQLSRKRPV